MASTEFDLVALALGREDFFRLLMRPDLLGERRIALNDLAHLLLDDRQVVGREGLVLGKVVIEAVFDDRADGHLCAGPQFLHSFGHDVRRIMPDQFQRAVVIAGDNLYLAFGHRIGKVAHGAVDCNGDGLLQAIWKWIRRHLGRLRQHRSCARNHREMSGKRIGTSKFSLSSPANECGWFQQKRSINVFERGRLIAIFGDLVKEKRL